jgi:hypothetical protein
MMISLAGGVAPFGDPGINDRSHLPRAFRSVPRPSSPLSAKASTRCPYSARLATPNGNRHPDIGMHNPDITSQFARCGKRFSRQKTLRAGSRRPSGQAPTAAAVSRAVMQLASSPCAINTPAAPAPQGKAPPAILPLLAASQKVEVIGLEPTTPCLQSRCSPS